MTRRKKGNWVMSSQGNNPPVPPHWRVVPIAQLFDPHGRFSRDHLDLRKFCNPFEGRIEQARITPVAGVSSIAIRSGPATRSKRDCQNAERRSGPINGSTIIAGQGTADGRADVADKQNGGKYFGHLVRQSKTLKKPHSISLQRRRQSDRTDRTSRCFRRQRHGWIVGSRV